MSNPLTNAKRKITSLKILALTQVQSQEVIEKFMRKRKSKQERAEKNKKALECAFILLEEPNKNKLTEIVELLEHLNAQEEKNVINLIVKTDFIFLEKD